MLVCIVYVEGQLLGGRRCLTGEEHPSSTGHESGCAAPSRPLLMLLPPVQLRSLRPRWPPGDWLRPGPVRRLHLNSAANWRPALIADSKKQRLMFRSQQWRRQTGSGAAADTLERQRPLYRSTRPLALLLHDHYNKNNCIKNVSKF